MLAQRKAWAVTARYGSIVAAVFRTKKRAERWIGKEFLQIVETTWKEGVAAVRLYVFQRDQYTCVRCGKSVTWKSGQMDEKQDRGKGGEVSIFNCRTLCGDCHIGPRGKHGKRASRFTRKRI
jgi:5-methylcytosine-specific restriction endonuclease McrA